MPFQPPLLPPYSYTEGDPPALPLREPGDNTQPESIVRATLIKENECGLELRGFTGMGLPMNLAVSFVAPGIVRILLEDEKPDPPRVMLARQVGGELPKVGVEKFDRRIGLVTELLRVQIDLDPFHIAFLDSNGCTLLDQNGTLDDIGGRLISLPFGFSVVGGRRVAFHDTFTAEPDEHFYGFGEKFTDLDKRGQRLEMWNYDAGSVQTERAYKNVPFFLSTRGYGIFVDSVTHVNFDMAASTHAAFSLIVPDSALDYYVIAGPDPKAIISRYAHLVSFPTLPPKWAFGLWVSSGFDTEHPDDADDVLTRVRLLREYQIPCDVYHQDAYWQRFGCWSDLNWDTERFPDPEGLIEQIKEQGFKFSLWLDPRIGIESERFREAKDKGYLLKRPDGEAYITDSFDGFHPPAGNLDFTNPEAAAWFRELLQRLLRMGVDVFKLDDGEKVPTNAVAHNGMTGAQLHNYYALLYHDLVSQTISEETGRVGLVWGRATYAGGQRHAAQWGGDPNSTYQDMASTLRGGLSLGLCGHPFWSHDIGGFHGRPTTDLYVRWAQFGLFSPLARLHGMSSRLPWEYGEEALHIVRDYVRLRYRLLPYIYTYAVIGAETSLPLLRAMMLEFPDDPNTYTLDLQYMFGSEFLLAPIYNSSGRRPVYFPAGRWVDYWTHEVIEGETTRWIQAPLHVLPLYVRANALIPAIPTTETIADAPFERVMFDAYLIERGSFTLRDNDGHTRVDAAFEGTRLNVTVEGAKQELILRVVPLAGAPRVESVYINGVDLKQMDGWTRELDGTVQVQARKC